MTRAVWQRHTDGAAVGRRQCSLVVSRGRPRRRGQHDTGGRVAASVGTRGRYAGTAGADYSFLFFCSGRRRRSEYTRDTPRGGRDRLYLDRRREGGPGRVGLLANGVGVPQRAQPTTVGRKQKKQEARPPLRCLREAAPADAATSACGAAVSRVAPLVVAAGRGGWRQRRRGGGAPRRRLAPPRSVPSSRWRPRRPRRGWRRGPHRASAAAVDHGRGTTNRVAEGGGGGAKFAQPHAPVGSLPPPPR